MVGDPPMTDTPVNITTSALVPVLRSIVTKLLVAAGTALVSHGMLTQTDADGLVGPLAQELVGAIIALGSAAYAAFAAKYKNQKAVTAALAKPGDGTVTLDGAPV